LWLYSKGEDEMQGLRQALSAVVIERSQHPRFEGILPRIDRAGSAINPYCGDAVSVVVALDAGAERLMAVRCSVDGCAVCKASADLMAECVEGSTIKESCQMDEAFQHVLRTGEISWPIAHPLAPFAALHLVPARAGCAALPWQALRQVLRPAPRVAD
jgi:nitrogen fixation NifU-like protein